MDNIRTTQCDTTDFVSIFPVELRGREFPMSQDEIIEALKDENLNSVKTMLNYRPQAWCLFSVVEGDIVIHRLAVKDDTFLHDILDNLFATITYSPTQQKCLIRADWPEYAVDHFVFRYLIETGWTTDGLIKDCYRAYGQTWDGIKLEKVF